MKSEYTKQIHKFLELGFTERESKVYITLLSKRSFTSSELQKSAGIPRTKIYEVLYKMIDKGICVERQSGKIKYYEAVEPKKALHKMLEDYKNNYQNEFEKKKAVTEELAGIFSPVFEKNKTFVSPLEFVDVVKDKDQSQKIILNAFQNAKSEVLSLIKGPYVCNNIKRVKEQVREERNVLKRGVGFRKIYEIHELSEEAQLIEHFKPLSKFGSQMRVIDRIPIKMLVIDERMVIFPLQDVLRDPNELTLIIIEHKEMVLACRILFDYLWNSSKPMKM